MKTKTKAKLLAAGVGLATASYATYAGVTWIRYGNPKRAARGDGDALLDLLMPNYEVVDRQKISVAAPAEVTLCAATEMHLEDSTIIRAIFKGREFILGGKPDHTVRPRKLVKEMEALGWGVLAEIQGREIVMGGVTKPWEANPVFQSLLADEFAAFQEPGYVKIAWTLRANPDGAGNSVFRTETRAVATDPESRRKFRRYWSLLSPGIIAIRNVMLPAVKAAAERRWEEIAA